jgi:hypothetical protein
MAPQAILELVDGSRDMQFSMTARRVARSSILGTKWLSESAKDAMYRVIQFRDNGVKEFDEEVERQKRLLLKEDKMYEAWRRTKETKTVRDIEDRVDQRTLYTTSRHNRRKWKEIEEKEEDKKRKDAKVSEEEKKKEYEQNVVRYKKDDDDTQQVSEPQTKEEQRAARLHAKRSKKVKQIEERRQRKQIAE